MWPLSLAAKTFGKGITFVLKMKTFLKILTLFIAIGAIGGTVMMWMDPSGVSWGGEPMLDLLRAKMPWPDVFSRNFIPSGFVLLAVNGLTQLLAALMLFKNHRRAYWAVLICGIILMIWIVQVREPAGHLDFLFKVVGLSLPLSHLTDSLP